MGIARTNTFNEQRGVAVIEFAFVLIFLLILTLGITELGRSLWYYAALQKAVREGARCESIITPPNSGATPDDSCMTQVVNDANQAGINPQLDPSQVKYNYYTYSGSAYVTVSVADYQMPWLWSLRSPVQPMTVNRGTSVMSVTATMPYMK